MNVGTSMENPWIRMQRGDSSEAIRTIADSFKRDPSASRSMELGVALLWSRAYESAWDHFRTLNNERPAHSACYYGMAGAALWCLQRRDEAAGVWRDGFRCQYADAAGGVELPLLLHVASVLDPQLDVGGQAVGVLAHRVTDRRIKNWPGPIVEFVLGRRDERSLKEYIAEQAARDQYLAGWHADFYIGIGKLASGRVKEFNDVMRICASVSDTDLNLESPEYLGKMWHAEYFLARHEAERDSCDRPATLDN